MTKNKYLNVLIILSITIAAVLIFPFVIKLTLPFIISFFIAMLLQKPIKKFEKLGIKKGFSSVFFILILFLLVSLLFYLIGYKIFIESANFFTSLPKIFEDFNYQFNFFRNKYLVFYDNLSISTRNRVDILVKNVFEHLENFAYILTKNFGNIAKDFASKVPKFILSLIIIILSSFFISKDYLLVLNSLKKYFLRKVLKYLKG